MVNFFLLPFNPLHWETAKSDLIIDPGWYHNLMQRKWPEAKIYTPPVDSTYLLWWEINREGGIEFDGGLQNDQQVVSIVPGFKTSLAAFVLWHREIIPEQFQLFLTWEGTWESLEVKSNTSEQEIITFSRLVN